MTTNTINKMKPWEYQIHVKIYHDNTDWVWVIDNNKGSFLNAIEYDATSIPKNKLETEIIAVHKFIIEAKWYEAGYLLRLM